MNSKLRLIVALAIACVMQLSGIGKVKAQAQDNGCWMSIAFLGYYTDYNSFVSSASYPQLCQTYPDLQTIKNLAVDTPGEEFYLVIPSKGHDVVVNACTYDMYMQLTDKFEGEIYYKTENGYDASLGGKPFLMKCNYSDVFPSTMLVIDGAEGLETYYPHLDLNQGSLPYHPHVRDISRPLPQSEPDESGQYVDMGIRAMVKNGKAVILFDWDKLNSSGYIKVNGEDSYSNIRVVSEINGICRQVFVGSIDQDINPWLCLLMDDGTVKTLGLFDALHREDFAASPALPGFSDIRSFEEGGAGEYEPGCFSYGTIFGIDKTGCRHEIPVFLDDGKYTYEALTAEEGEHVTLLLTSNWRMVLMVTTTYEVAEFWEGSFLEVVKRDDSYDCDFRLRDMYSIERNQDKSGTFRFRVEDDKYTLIPVSGFALYGKRGQKIELKKVKKEWQ